MRTVVRPLIAVFLALAGPALAAPAVQASAQEVQQQSSGTAAASSRQLTVSIDAVSPNFATPNSTITVRGTVTNDTGSPLQGVQVQLLTQGGLFGYFGSRSAMASYAAGSNAVVSLQSVGTPYSLPGTLHSGSTLRWSASFQAGAAGYTTFGVYPLAAQAQYADGTPIAGARTFLPFWPSKGAATPLDVAWIWPLIGQPQQGACPQTLASNSLAGSLGSGGRLRTLLAVGQQWAERDQLTWAVDPALLSDANVMTRTYFTGGNAMCSGRDREPASTAASSWLSTLRGTTSGEPVFLTPYADADVSALTHGGLDSDLRTAYQLGASVASKILSRPFGTTGGGTGDGGSLPVAWPAGGTADASVLTSLARDGGISTVVLNSNELPSSAGPWDNALGLTTTGIGTNMAVLLADSRLTQVLGSASAGSSAAARFAAAQDFLAETAMILAEAPNSQRTLVVAPPRHWDPSAAEAAALLRLTSEAPWLHKVGLSSLAAAAGHLSKQQSLPGNKVSGAELSGGYLGQVKTVDASTELYKDLLYQPGASLLDSLDAAVAATESAAWRGGASAGGWLALAKLANYLADSEKKVTIITGKKILLAGASGETPVSVQNLGQVPVQVRVVATPPADGQLTVGKTDLIMVPPGKTNTVRVSLHSSAITTTTMQLQLVTRDGSPLTWTSQSLSVQATRYGRALLVLIGAALGVLVLTSAARWIRQWLNDGRAEGRSGGTG